MEMIPSGLGFSLLVSQPYSLAVCSLLEVAEMAAGAPASRPLGFKASEKEPALEFSGSLCASPCPPLNAPIVVDGTKCPERDRP